jgi:CHAT domain-containing protein/tetratricopeptide (TPR) repeat protein
MRRSRISRFLAVVLLLGCLIPKDAVGSDTTSAEEAEVGRLLDQGEYQDALPKARALATEVDTPAETDEVRLRVFQLVGRAEYEVGNYDAALVWDRKALPISRTIHGAASEQEASIQDDIGVQLRHLGKYDPAEAMFSEAFKTFSSLPHPDQALFSDVLINYGVLAYERGELAKAEQLTSDAVQRRRNLDPPKPASLAQSLDNLGVILQAEGRLAAARTPIEEALELRRRTLRPKHPDIAASLNNLGVLEQQRGDFADAEGHLREASDIDAKAFGKGDPQVLTDLSNLGEVLHSMDRPDEALALEKEVLEGREQQARKNGADTSASLDLAISNGNIGNLLRDLGRVEEANEHYKQALKLDRERAGASPTVDIALDLNNIGEGLRQSGDLVNAAAAFDEGIRVASQVGEPAERIRGSLLHNLGVVHASQGDLLGAEKNLRSAVELQRKVLPSDHPDLISTTAWLAEVLSARDQREAISMARSALASLEERGRRTEFGLSTAAVAADARSMRGSAENILSAIARSGERAGVFLRPDLADDALAALQVIQESGTAVVATRAAYALLASSPDGAAALRQIEDIRDQREEAASREALAAGQAAPSISTAVSASSGQLDARLRELLTSVPVDILALTHTPTVRLPDIAAHLDPAEGWLGVTIGDTFSVVVLVTQGGIQINRVSEGAAILAPRIQRLRSELDPGSQENFDLVEAHALYSSFFNGLGAEFDNLTALTVASDGALESLPLAVLVTRVAEDPANQTWSYQNSSWLSDRAVITITPSFTAALALRERPDVAAAPDPFIGFGDPALAPPTSAASDASAQVLSQLMFLQGTPAAVTDVRSLPSLPDTSAQLEAMNDFFASGHGAVVTQNAATKEAVERTDLGAFRVIAFATHGLLAAENSTGEPALVMTPAGDGDDGLLTATKIAGFKLRADLVVLSACNTAAPRVGYGVDGLSGLTQSFIHAGATAVLISHWPVDARATRSFMQVLGKHKGENTAKAFNAAASALRNQAQFAHPAFWAPFDLVGRGRELAAVSMPESPSPSRSP